MKALNVIAPIVLFGAVACGTQEGSDLEVSLEAPERSEARVSISAALEVSDLLDEGLAERVVIENITINLAEVRLLAADPRIPPGGYSLLSQDTLLEFYGAEDSKLELAFPEQFLAEEDLAVYLRIAPTEALESASIVVTGRYYANPLQGGQNELNAAAETTGAQDPDGDPVMPEDEESDEKYDDLRFAAQDPDGDPVDPGCAQDPDGDPVMCDRRSLVGRGDGEESVAFELRTEDVADLVATLGSESALDVVVGIPASRWFTEDVVTSLELALAEEIVAARTQEDEKQARAEKVVVVEAADRATEERMMRGGRDDYFVTNRDIDELTVRR